MAKKQYHLHLKGTVGYWNFDADYVDYVLNKHKDEQVNVLIDSLGGSVATALSISSAFKRHGNVHVHYVGMNASAATIASLGAARITIDTNAMYLVHKCSQMVFKWDLLNADQLQQLIEECEQAKKDLDKIDLNIAEGYAKRCKKEKEDLLALMKVGGWLNAQEALAWGFVDEITDDPEDVKPKVTEEVVDFMAAHGIPMPDLPVEDEKQSLLHQFKEFLRKVYPQESNNKQTTNTATEMKKVLFTVLASVLALDKLECEEGGTCQLTDEQMQTLETHVKELTEAKATQQQQLDEREQTINDLKAQLEEKDAELQALAKKPATESKQVTNQGQGASETSPLQDYCNEVKEAKAMLDQLKK